MAVLAETLARAALDLETLPETRLTGTLRDLKRALGVGREPTPATLPPRTTKRAPCRRLPRGSTAICRPASTA
jgi:hypothetical protein